ncbi:branched chain amino acid ABC transporter substrate-binding protein [Notoacmeibacter marinus]|uniref:Branched chain amino acid ABC transporter substrate-binding protein n=1 Tax=Notoacmeibacter marinus TaxID=1876515 RepID=A0A231V3D6_9HYPH|nr:branched-chain amino acid ABC transporter substrate-binding protein [Notoacmeibacter marinus]OXT02531.1 branched chain amino acid ABC transporter substrate-binding protein [Notoacmeibacter marinus]
MKKLLLAGVALGFMGAAPASAEILVAVAGPITGQYASFGAQMQAGAEQAVADINEAGGVNGEMLKLVVGDDACDPKQAVAVAQDFASQGVAFVAGHFCSGSSIPASSVYADEGIIQITPASTNPAYTDDRPGPGIYRVCGRDDQQGETAGAYLAKNFADANIAVINDKTAYGKGLADQTQAAMEAAGKDATVVESYSAGEKDYSALISKLKEEGVTVLYVGGYHTEAGLMARQAKEQGMDLQIVSGDALVTDEYWAITGDAGEGTLMTFSPDPRNNEGAAEIVKELEDAGKPTEGYVLYTYAAIQAFKQAAETAGSTEFDAMVTALDDGEFDTVLGNLSFDDKGDVSLPGYVFYEWSGGKYTQMDTAMADTGMEKKDDASMEKTDDAANDNMEAGEEKKAQ